MSKFLCAALALGTVSALTIPASAADYAGRWEISGRQFGMVPPFHPITDGRLVISGSGGNVTATYNALRFTGGEQKDGLHLDCTSDGKPCGAFVLQEAKGKLTGSGTMGGERIDITGQRPAAKPAGATAHEFVPKRFHTNFSGDTPSALRIFPGDSVHTETVDNRGYDGKNVQRSTRGNPLTGPFYVEGAMPGDTLVVHLKRVRLNRDYAMQASSIAGNALNPGYLRSEVKGDGIPNTWKLDAATNTGVLEKPGERLRDYKVPLMPMLGCVGVAPPRQQAIASSNLGPWGGNLDSQSVREGTTVYLPVFQPGALLYIGDTHAQQGDGELPGQAMETSMDVTFSVEVIEGKNLGQTWIDTGEEIGVMGVGGSLDESLRVATTGMALWLADRYGLNQSEIAAVLGTAMRYEIAEVVDPQINIVAKIRKEMLARFVPDGQAMRLRLPTLCLALCAALCASARAADYRGADRGYLVFSVSSLGLKWGFGLKYRKLGEAEDAGELSHDPDSFFSPKEDFSGRETGHVEVQSLRPGDYEIYRFDTGYHTGVSDALVKNAEEFSIPFSIRPGGATYIGNFGGVKLIQDNMMHDIDKIYFVMSDQHERDLEIAKQRQPELPQAIVSIMDVEKLDNPFFQTKEDCSEERSTAFVTLYVACKKAAP